MADYDFVKSLRTTNAKTRNVTVRKGLKTLKVAKKPNTSVLATRKIKSKATASTVNRAIHKYSEIGLQDLAILLFGEDAVKEVKKKMDVREIWNISTNTTQCNNVIGKSDANTECWICGLKIDPRDAGMKPECEHILPVAQAIVYLSLYSAKKAPYTEEEKRVIELEYGWAHTVCNQDKSDICCIVKENNRAVVSDNNIKYILKKIYNSNRADASEIKRQIATKYGGSLASFIEGRMGPVKQKYQNIVDFLNPQNGEDRFKLTILAGLVTAMDYTNIHDEAQTLLSDEFIAQRESEKNMLKELLTNNIKNDIYERLGYLDLDILANVAEILEKIETYFRNTKEFSLDRHRLKKYGLNDRLNGANNGANNAVNMASSANNSQLVRNDPELYSKLTSLAKIYPALYSRLALMFINPTTKSYNRAKVESNTIQCLGAFLTIKYFIRLKQKVERNNKIRIAEKKKITAQISSAIEEIKTKNIDTPFPGIYDFINEYDIKHVL